MWTVQRLGVTARLDDPESALARAEKEAAAGDESWSQWLAEYERGEALILRLEVSLEATNGEAHHVEARNRGVWIEKDVHVPKVEMQIAELVAKDFAILARALSARGDAFDRSELGEMYVHVELKREVCDALTDAGARRRTKRPPASKGEASLSQRDSSRDQTS